MSREPAIEIESLWKLFRLERTGKVAHPRHVEIDDEPESPEAIQVRQGRAFWALSNINLTIERGESVGIIGRNGAGKSTLLKILARVTAPTRGRARIYGKLASLLEVGTAFHQELSGRENIALNAMMLGMAEADINRCFDKIVDFSGIGDFIEMPVKHLSTGMRMRLGFSIAVHVEPEVLIVDEVLAVGDAEFVRKCRKHVMEIVATADRTVLVVSHSLGEIVNLCSRVVFMDEGRIVADGSPEETIQRYLAGVDLKPLAHDIQTVPLRGASAPPTADSVHPMLHSNDIWHLHERSDRSGDGRVRFASVEFLDAAGQRVKSIGAGEPVTFKLGYQATSAAVGRRAGAVSIAMCSDEGSRIFGMPSRIAMDGDLEFLESGTLYCHLPALPLIPGAYKVDISCLFENAVADKLRAAAVLIVKATRFHGTGMFPNETNGRVLVRYQWSDCDPRSGSTNAPTDTY